MGYSREQYERTKALPEGSYRISFIAYDYRRQDVQVSNEGSSFYYLSKNEPPLINMPVCGAKVPVRHPQQVVFSWLPRNTSSPASAGGTQYELIGSGIEIHNNQKALEATGLLFALYDTFDEVSLSLNLDNIVDYSVDGLGMPNRRYQSQS